MIKKILNITLCSFLLLLASCSYLDVKEKGIVGEKEMFNDVDGFHSAMYGVYSYMNTNTIYGCETTFGFLNEICYQYSNVSDETFKKILKHEYLAVDVRSKIDAIWNDSYKTISYINNILAHVDNGVLDRVNYAYVKGEALGLRAFIHFDILRMFSKTYKYSGELGIPYQTKFSLDVPPTGTIKQTCDLILNDLLEAEELLKNYSDMYRPIDSNSSEEEKNKPKPESDYYLEQTLHFNLYAVKATLARVYLYMGENILAAKKAKEVIDSENFPLMTKTQIEGVNCFYPNKKEAIFGLYSNTIYSKMYNKFVNNAKMGDAINNIRYIPAYIKNELYESSTFTDSHSDSRYSSYFTPSDRVESSLLVRFGKEEYVSSNKNNSNVSQGITLIQIPEMYYIFAEASFTQDKELAIAAFNFFINSRGLRNIDAINPIETKEQMVKAVYKERLKEYFGTGMVFFENKRLNMDMVDLDKNVVNASDNIYVFPWPELEKEYGTAK